MQQLWAPWRMEFIRQPKPQTCFFCDAARADDDRAALLLCRTEHCLCLMNRYPYSNGHVLIAPQRHEGEIERLSRDELAEMNLLVQRSVGILREAVAAQGFNVGANLGKIAGAGVADHLHYHVVPRWEGDTNFMPVMGDAKVIPQALDELYDALKPRFDPPT